LGDGFEGEILGGNFSIKQARLIVGSLEFGIGQKGLIHEVFSNLVSIECSFKKLRFEGVE
jgi:hypothetical protein